MYNKNILVPLKTFIPKVIPNYILVQTRNLFVVFFFFLKISATLSQFLSENKKPAESVQKIIYELADNVITTIWCLSWVFLIYAADPLFNIRRETSNKALNAINELHLVPFLMSFLAARDRLPLAPVTSAGTCAHKPWKCLLSWLSMSVLKRNVFMS